MGGPDPGGEKPEVGTPASSPTAFESSGHNNGPARSDLLLVGVWAIIASALGRGLSEALPGSSAGIERLIAGAERLAEFSSQFMVMMGTATSVRLLLWNLERRGRWFRPVAIISCAAALPVVISASSRHLDPPWLIALVALSALLAFTAGGLAVRVAHSRALGLVLLAVTAGSLVTGAARVLALYASQQAHATLFGLARGIATLGLGLDTLSVVIVAVWLGRRMRLHGIWVVATLLAAATLLASAGLSGNGAATWQVVVGRALAAFTAHPDPFIGSGFRYFVEALALLLASVTLWFPRPAGVGAALAFALLARVSGDVPLCALMLMLAALSAVSASLQSHRPNPALSEPPGRRAALEVVPATR